MTALLLAALSLLQEDPEVAEYRRLLEEANQAKATGHDSLADKLTEKVRAKFHSAILDHREALKSKDAERRERTGPRLAAMARLVTGDQNLDPQDLDHPQVLQLLELYSADKETRSARYQKVLDSLRDELKAMEIPDGFKSILPPPLREDENGAGIYEQAFGEMKSIETQDPKTTELLDREPLFSDVSEARDHLKRYSGVVSRLREAAAKPGARFPVDYDQGPEALLSHIAPLIRSEKILRGCAVAHAMLAESEAAWESCLLQFEVASCNLHEPLMVSALVNAVLLGIVIDSVQAVAKQAPPSDETVRRIEKAMQRIDPKAMFARALQGEACSAIISVEGLVLGPIKKAVFAPETETYFREDLLLLLGFLRKAREALTKDYPMLWENAQALDPREQDLLPLTALLLPALGRSVRSAICMEASLRTARVGLAGWRFKAKHGTVPAKLEDLVPEFLGELPNDPFTGKPLLYRNGKIYSVGGNGKDDQGVMESDRDDVAFTLP